ncbi:hypothetical protein [Burkholderia sp. 3C]
MAVMACRHHGRADGEYVTKTLAAWINDRSKWRDAPNVVLLRAMDDTIEFPFFAIENEVAALMEEFGGVGQGEGVYQFADERRFDALMGRVTAACLRCLGEMGE